MIASQWNGDLIKIISQSPDSDKFLLLYIQYNNHLNILSWDIISLSMLLMNNFKNKRVQDVQFDKIPVELFRRL